eukprot:s32_g14.t1
MKALLLMWRHFSVENPRASKSEFLLVDLQSDHGFIWFPSERSAATPLQRVSCAQLHHCSCIVFRTDRGSQQMSASLWADNGRIQIAMAAMGSGNVVAPVGILPVRWSHPSPGLLMNNA